MTKRWLSRGFAASETDDFGLDHQAVASLATSCADGYSRLRAV